MLNADALEGGQFTVNSEIWSDYDGDEIYGDFTVHQEGAGPPEAKQERSFVMGLATVGWTDNPQGERGPDDPSLRYYHGDMIGTTRFMTDFIGDPGEEAVYTAFGERIDGDARRFGYAGAWGYQSTLDDQTPPAEVFPFLHVGARYYDPATGRFLQRDPIGIRGGLNVYEYVGSAPSIFVDPTGLGILDWIKDVASAIQEAVEGILGTSSPAKAARGPIDVTARAMECGPDIARITIAKKHRDRLIDDEGDLNDALDAYDDGLDAHVKPGSGPAG